MPKKAIYTEVEGQRLKITNLDKVIYPTIGLTKAEIISYYLEMAPYMLLHVARRPLTLIRYPDGVGGKNFYGKNKPSWTPEWMPTTTLPWNKDNDYLYAKNAAHLVWLANLAALEIHTMNSMLQTLDQPDNFIIDLDPDEGYDFEDVKQLALDLKEFLEGYGYVPFAKLSGGKGIHINTPITIGTNYETMGAAVKELIKEFMKTHPKTTLFVDKDKRKGKVLLDIYRNHPGNTTIAPYSLRGKIGAPVSMPLPWEEIKLAKSAQDYTLATALNYVKENGDAWQNMQESAVELHTLRSVSGLGLQVTGAEHQTPDTGNLIYYDRKRDFSKTAEPGDLNPDSIINGKYVIQMHDATNLHFDLRLGVDGVLKSWAIPKGLPLTPGVKRLAIETEDHPAKYYNFEGSIPKEEYGGGQMWVFEQGNIEWIKQSDNSLKFTLNSESAARGGYSMYKLKGEDQWIIERKDEPERPMSEIEMTPMLAEMSKTLPSGANHVFEIKWDGIRAIIYKNGGDIKIVSRGGKLLNNKFPEFLDGDYLHVEHAIIDVEIVCLDVEGKPVFSDVISRMHSIGGQKIKNLAKSKPAYLYVFDCMYLNGQEITKLPLSRRQEYLNAILKTGDKVRISEVVEDGKSLFEAVKQMGLEGIMAKEKEGKYSPGQRTMAWKKIKVRQDIELQIIGYTAGKGGRANVFGALHLAERDGDGWKYYGKVGTGFDMAKLREIKALLNELPETAKPITESIEEADRTTWVEPKYRCKVSYASMSSNEALREPVFIELVMSGK